MSLAGAGGPTRRGFLLAVGGAAAALGCQRTPSAESEHVGAGCPPGGVDQDILAVRDHRLHVDTPPSFVFSTGFRDVP